MNDSLSLGDVEFRCLRDYINERFGLYLKDEKRSFIQRRLLPRLIANGVGSFKEYLDHLRHESNGRNEIMPILALLTNNETYFFREVPQLTAFKEHVLPQAASEALSRQERSLRIVSAGCSTGEEAYSLAMLAYDIGTFFWGWDLKIIGLDISAAALEMAREATYYERSVRMMQPEQIERYLVRCNSTYKVKEIISRMASFRWGNIANDLTWKPMESLDAIFCRNVMIYFSADKVEQTVMHMRNALRLGGYLFLGHSETLTGVSEDFELVRFKDTIGYRRKA